MTICLFPVAHMATEAEHSFLLTIPGKEDIYHCAKNTLESKEMLLVIMPLSVGILTSKHSGSAATQKQKK